MKHETLVKYTKNFPTFFPLKWEKSWAESSLVKLRSNYALPDTAKLKPSKYYLLLTAVELLTKS